MTNECVVHSYLLDGKGGGQRAEVDTDGPASGQQIKWFHIEYTRSGSYQWLIDQGLDERVAETLTRVDSRPRMLNMGTGTVVILRGVNVNPGAAQEDMVSIRVWIESGRIITVRQFRVASIQDICAAVELGEGPETEGEFLVMLVERLASRISEAVDDIEQEIADVELQTDISAEIRSHISSVRRKTAAIRRFLAPQRDALDAVHRMSKNLLTETELHYLREQTDRTTRYVEDLDLARERTLVAQEELQNRIAEQQNSRTYLLSIVAALFLPLSFLTGVFGMNVAGLPGTEDGMAFNYLTLSMIVLAVVLLLWMWKKKWL
jgi:zinc transporter